MVDAGSKAAVEAISGGIGSLISTFVTYPLKTIYTLKAIRAVKDEARRENKEGSAEADNELRRVAGCPIAAVCAICREQLRDVRIGTLYAGLMPTAVETFTSNIVYFYLYSLLKQAALSLRHGKGGGGKGRGQPEFGVAASLVVAALAGAGNMLVTTPAQVVSTMMIANSKKKRQLEREGLPAGHISCDTLGVCREISRQDGVCGYWRGLLPSLILVVNPAVQYALFEWGMQRAQVAKARRAARAGGLRSGRVVSRGPPRLGAGEVFLIGALAKIGATVVTYPMIVVKSRLQATNEHTADENRYSGTQDAVLRIFREEGFYGFFPGLQTKILQTAINAGLMLALKDSIARSSTKALAALSAGRR